MAKSIKIGAKVNTDKENPESIDIVHVMKDRLILEPIVVNPIKRSDIIDPNTNKPYEDKASFDRYPFRCLVRFCGEDIMKDTPIRPGHTVFVETYQATSQIVINGELLVTTRMSNILLVYKELEKKSDQK